MSSHKPNHKHTLAMLSFAVSIHVGLLWRSCDDSARIHLSGGSQIVHLTLPGTKALSARTNPKNRPRSHRQPAPSQAPAAESTNIAASNDFSALEDVEAQDNVPTETSSIGDAAPTGPIDLGLGAAQGSLGEFEAMVLERIRSHEYYPKSARLRRIEGDVTLQFTILTDGTLADVNISDSSGHDLLDTTAKDILVSSTPFPAPATYGLGQRRYVLPLYFRVSPN